MIKSVKTYSAECVDEAFQTHLKWKFELWNEHNKVVNFFKHHSRNTTSSYRNIMKIADFLIKQE
jgi:hypothetical protein